MANRRAQRSNVSQLQRYHGDTGWGILCELRRPGADGRWSIASEGTEEAALERAKHLIRLGFVVHAIKNPAGSVFMDERQIAEQFAVAEGP